MAKYVRNQKTNALRMVEKAKLPYEVYTYPWQEEDLDARLVGPELNRPVEQIFKTLVAVGDKTGPMVAVIPSQKALDLKKLARASGNKRVEMLHLKELEEITGYIRGGCSPIGMKKKLPTYIAEEVEALKEVLVSAGRRGLQMGLQPKDLLKMTEAQVAEITSDIAF